jgi:hypothetical protein
MKGDAMKTLFYTLSLFISLTLLGCETTQNTAATSTGIAVAINNTNALRIENTQVRQVENQLLIQGTIRRDLYEKRNLHGHIQVTLMNQAGEIITEKQVAYQTALLIPDGIRRARFEACFDAITTQPQKVVLSLHRDQSCSCDA